MEKIESIQSGDWNLLGLLIGVGAIQFMISLLIGERVKNSIKNEYITNIERYKNDLIKKTFIYEEQIAAYKAFAEIGYKIYPEKHYKVMEYTDAVESIASSFSQHHKSIESYLKKHAAILPKSIRDKIDDNWHLCSEGKLEVDCYETTNEGYDMAEKLWKSVDEIEGFFRQHLGIDAEIKKS